MRTKKVTGEEQQTKHIVQEHKQKLCEWKAFPLMQDEGFLVISQCTAPIATLEGPPALMNMNILLGSWGAVWE